MVHIQMDESGFPILNERNHKYNQLAYTMMTPEQIEMSKQRESEVMHEEFIDYIKDLRQFEEHSRKVIPEK